MTPSRVFIEGMPLALPFNDEILSRNGRIYPGYHRPGGPSMIARGNIIKGDQDFGTLVRAMAFGTVESQKSPLLPLAISYRMPFICVSSCQKFEKVSGTYIYKI